MATFKVRDKQSGKVFTIREKATKDSGISPAVTGPIGLAQGASVQDIPAILTSLASGVTAGLPEAAAQRPAQAAVTGPVGVQAASGTNIAQSLVNLLSTQPQGAPFPSEQRQIPLPQPVTQRGQQLATGAGAIGAFLGPGATTGVGAEKGLAESVARVAGPRTVRQVQQAFPAFRKAATTKFGQALRRGRLTGSEIKIANAESQAIFSPILGATEEASAQIPRVAKLAAKQGENLSVVDLLRKKATLRRALSVAEREGRLITDRSRAIGQTIKNIDSSVKNKIPGIESANKDYAVFSRIKEMIEKFDPKSGGLPGLIGTEKGTRLLKRIFRLEPGEIELLKRYEQATGLNIVEPAKFAATVRAFGRILGKILPIVVGFQALKASGADEALFTALDLSQ